MPRCVGQPLEAGREARTDPPSEPRGSQPCRHFNSRLPAYKTKRENKHLLFEATKFVVICSSSSLKLTQQWEIRITTFIFRTDETFTNILGFFFFFFFCLFVFLGPYPWHLEVPGEGSNRSCRRWPTPQPQQGQIQAGSATYTTAHGNAGSLTH